MYVHLFIGNSEMIGECLIFHRDRDPLGVKMADDVDVLEIRHV